MCETCGDSEIWTAWVYGPSGYGPALIPCPTCKPETWPDSQVRLNTLIYGQPHPPRIDPDDPAWRELGAEIDRAMAAEPAKDAVLTIEMLERAREYLGGSLTAHNGLVTE